MKRPPEELIAHLEISSWIGTSMGARHVYGDLYGYTPEYTKIKLEHPLTNKQVLVLNEDDDMYGCWDQGDLSYGFDNEEELIEFTKNVWKEYFPKARFLLEGNIGYIEPKKLIDSYLSAGIEKKLKTQFAKLTDKEQSYDDKNSDNDIKRDKLYEKWYNLFSKYF